MSHDVNAAYFSIENLEELTSLDDHLTFVDALSTKYREMVTETDELDGELSISERDWKKIANQIKLVREKKNDNKINLSVIGEFSTGKSTFINALLGKEILVSSALQGTTVASTIIDYDDHHALTIEYLDGRENIQLSFTSFEKMKETLETYTTTPEIAKQLKTIRVYLPLPILQNDFRIIDTPGTNVTEAWHEDVTIRTIKRQSDLSIILLSAEKQLTSTSSDFIGRHLMGILPQCIFVTTKVDLLRERERKIVLSYIKTKIEETFKLDNAVTLPFASLLLLDSDIDERSPIKAVYQEGDYKQSSLLAMSLHTLEKIVEHTKREKTIAITKKLASLIDESYELISGNLKVMTADYEGRMELLSKSKTVDLSEFVQNAKIKGKTSYTKNAAGVIDDIDYAIRQDSRYMEEYILKQFDACNNIDKMKDFITNKLPHLCTESAESMLKMNIGYFSFMKDVFVNEMKAVAGAFSTAYETLEIIPIDMMKDSFDYPDHNEIGNVNTSSTAAYITEELKKENASFFGGMAAGAAIGTIFAPGVGTVIGGVIGLVAGGAVGPNKDKVHSEGREKLKIQLRGFFDTIVDGMVHVIDNYSAQLTVCMEDELDQYISRYHDEVDRMIQEEKQVKLQLMRQSKELEHDEQDMINHKKQLESVISHLNLLGRKEA